MVHFLSQTTETKEKKTVKKVSARKVEVRCFALLEEGEKTVPYYYESCQLLFIIKKLIK